MGTIRGSLWAVGGRGSPITAQRMETLDSLEEKTCHLLSPERGNRPKVLRQQRQKEALNKTSLSFLSFFFYL